MFSKAIVILNIKMVISSVKNVHEFYSAVLRNFRNVCVILLESVLSNLSIDYYRSGFLFRKYLNSIKYTIRYTKYY